MNTIQVVKRYVVLVTATMLDVLPGNVILLYCLVIKKHTIFLH